ncbi:MAG: hypothetical protein KJ749_07385, partial [Planctomycetes bacterium]|nr:hypothetical protein [Planctomycetota bacterium]
MRGLVLYEDESYANFLPLVGWRSVAELRVGRKIILDVVAQRLGLPVVGVWTRDWLASIAAQRCGAPANLPLDGPAILANGRWLPGGEVQFSDSSTIGVIGDEIAYIVCDETLAGRLASADLLNRERRCSAINGLPQVEAPG